MVLKLTFIQIDVNEIKVEYQITSHDFNCLDIYHQGIGTFTTIACCYKREKNHKGYNMQIGFWSQYLAFFI